MHNKIYLSLLMFNLAAASSPDQVLANLSLRQKIGQLFVVAAASSHLQPNEQLASAFFKSPYNMNFDYVENLVKNDGIGGVIFLWHSRPEVQINFTKKLQNLANVPLLIVQDGEWGLSMRLSMDLAAVVKYPHNLTLGAIKDINIVYEVAKEIGAQCAAIGVHLNLAPVVDVNSNKLNPVIHDRSFGDNPERVAKLANLFALGLKKGGVLACAKHFPGHGDTVVDSHFDLPVVKHDLVRLNQVELVPFKMLIQNQIPAIMHAHLSLPQLDQSCNPASLSYEVVTKLLQKELNFKGLNITDGLGMQAVMQKYQPGYLELQAFLAGNDFLLCPLDVVKAIDLIEEAILTGVVSEHELDRRVLKILQAKDWAFRQQLSWQQNDIEQILAYLVRPEAYELQARAYRAAITLLPQDVNLDLSIEQSCFLQIGRLPENKLIRLCEEAQIKIFNYQNSFLLSDLEHALNSIQDAQTVYISLAETNKFVLQNFGISDKVGQLISRLKFLGKKVVVLLFGTPYSAALFKQADAIVLGYEELPVVQEAIFDVITGKYLATGSLPVKI